MPTYNFIDTETGEEFEMFMKISEREDFLKENLHILPVLTAPAIVSGVSTSKQNRVPDGFKEVLAKVAESHQSSVVADRVGNKSIKNVRTREIVDKHYKKATGK
jgi:hypothetical protein